MAVADTARLLASYELQDKSAAGVRSALGGVNKLQAGVGGLGSKLSGFASNLKNNVGGALTHFGGRLKSIGLGIAAAAGIGGLLSFTGALEKSLGKAQEWGLQIEKLQGITRNSAESLSGLLAVTEKYGLANERLSQIAGFTEKALGAQALTAKKAAAFHKTYGFAIVDAHGKVKDFNSLILQFSDFWNKKGIPASTKAAAAAKLFGRGYADLVPILNLGAKGIAAAEQEAKDLGLTLSQDNVKQLATAREATRKWGDAIGGLQLQIGLHLLPTLTELATAATGFVREHGADITKFFVDAVAFAKTAAGTIGGFVSKVGEFWNSIPAGFRDLLIKGIVADRTVKFLFGISPIKLAVSLAADALGGIAKRVGQAVAGSLAGSALGSALGSLKPIPVFVVNEGFGGLPGVGGAVAGAAGGGLLAGILTVGLTAAAIAGIGAAFIFAVNQIPDPTNRGGAAGGRGAAFGPLGEHGTRTDPLFTHQLNGPGSPDDRDARRESAMQTARALDDKFERLQNKIQDSGATLLDIASNTALSARRLLEGLKITGRVPSVAKLPEIATGSDPFGFKHLKAFAFGEIPKSQLRPELVDHLKDITRAIKEANAKGDTVAAKKLQETKAGLEKLLGDVKDGTFKAGEREYKGALQAARNVVTDQRDTRGAINASAHAIVAAIEALKLSTSVKVFVDKGDVGNRTTIITSTPRPTGVGHSGQ